MWTQNELNPYFPNVPEFGNLKIDYVLLDYDWHILFTCKNECGNLYIVYCCDVCKEQRWIIAPITKQSLIDVLMNKLTEIDAFRNAEGTCCVATWTNDRDVGDVTYRMLKSAKEFDENDLPPEGLCLNDDGECSEYLNELLNVHVVQNGWGVVTCISSESIWKGSMLVLKL